MIDEPGNAQAEDRNGVTDPGFARANPDPQSSHAYILNLESRHSGVDWFIRTVRNFLRQSTTPLLLVIADLVGIMAAGQGAIWIRHFVDPIHFGRNFYPVLFAYSGVVIIAFLAVGFYPGIGRSGPEELRRLSITTTILMFIMTTITYVTRGHFDYGVTVYLIAWLFALFTIPLARATMRGLLSRRSWWGAKAIILGSNVDIAKQLVENLEARPHLGIKPVAIISSGGTVEHCGNVRQLHGINASMHNARKKGIRYAIVATSDLNDPEGLCLIKRYENCFNHWIIAPSFVEGYSLWVRTKDFGGILGLELSHRLLNKSDQFIKRVMDLLMTGILGILFLPFLLILAAGVKLDSRGPALYKQERIGKDGKPFKAYKFRSMVQDADKVLAKYLESNPTLKARWEKNQKLKNDPRITRFGRFIRKTSLDELPQILNVLRGEMSLVGPRPCTASQICYYDSVWDLYTRVRPGITGQWQISGRNKLSFKERTRLDAYYIRNWSVWLDIYILARTPLVILRQDGAY